ncbi:MAG: hypothetical protein ACKV2Q_24100 [Planctomycetaceae bacterium]
MRSQSRSSLSLLMFLLPLLGVPLMAIFGVPHFVPVIASSVSDKAAHPTTHPTKTRRSSGVGESAAATAFVSDKTPRDIGSRDDDRLQDLFRPAKTSPRDSRPLRGEPSGHESKFVETSLGADTWLTQTSAADRAADIFGERPTQKPPGERDGVAPSVSSSKTEMTSRNSRTRESSDRGLTTSATEASDQGLTWREAVRRLNALGIQEFRLEPGRQLGEFYFACEFAPDRDTRITRRFEAEAQEPLLAVAAVLRQIDEWQPRR